MSTLSLHRVSKHWGPTVAVDDVSFEAASGGFVVLLGPSGCGKSTTLRMIAGLDAPTHGRIVIDGRDVTRLPPAKRRISMVFQSYALFPHLSVRENILFGVKVRREPTSSRTARLARVSELLGLSALLDRKPSQLSGGQQQRVALGRAIIAETPVCLMDEPLSNLDAKLRQEMRREIRALQRKLGMTMVYVTHDQTEAMSMADQVVLLEAGRIVQDAPPAELYARPATVFAARFIGTPPMNVLPLGLVDSDATGGVLVGVRPEHVRLARGGQLRAIVQSAEYFGADTIVTCALPGASENVDTIVTCALPGASENVDTIAVRVPGQLPIAVGEPVWLDWDDHAQHFFDAATGRRRDDVRAPAVLQPRRVPS